MQLTSKVMTTHLPEGQEDHCFDNSELQQRIEGGQQLMRAHVEEHKGVQGHCVSHIVYDCYPQIPATIAHKADRL